MTQLFNKGMLGTRQKPAIEYEWVIPLPKCTAVAGRMLTLEVGALYKMGITENMLAGQEIYVLNDDAGTSAMAGYKLRVESNTSLVAGADLIYLEEEVQGAAIWAELPAALATTDRLACSTRGIHPDKIDTTAMAFNNATGLWDMAVPTTGHIQHTVDELFGAIDQATLPDPKHSIEEPFAHGSANMPSRHFAVHNRITYETTWPILAIVGKRLFGIFGSVVDNASLFEAGGGSSTLANDVIAGDNVLKMVAVLNFAAGDYVEIGNNGHVEEAGADSEIRKIVEVSGNYLILDAPVRRTHQATDDVDEIDDDCFLMDFTTGEYIKHTLTIGHSTQTQTIGVNKRGEEDDVAVEDLYMSYTGHIFSGATFKSTTDSSLKVDIPSKGLYAERDPDFWDSVGVAYEPIPPPALDTSYFYNAGDAIEPVHFSDSYLKYGGVQWHQNEDFNLTITREIDTKYSHSRVRKALPGTVANSRRGTDSDGLIFGRNPYGHYGGRVTYTTSQVVPLHNKEIIDILREKGALEVEFGFSIVRSATFTETWVFTIGDMVLEDAGTELPNTPTENQNLVGPPDAVSLVIKDRVHYY